MSDPAGRCPTCGTPLRVADGSGNDDAFDSPDDEVDAVVELQDPSEARTAGVRRWRRTGLAVLVVAAAVVAGVAVLADDTEDEEAASPSTTARAAPTATRSPTASGPLLPEATELALVTVAGDGRFVHIDLDTGRATHPDVRLASGNPGVGSVLVVDGSLVALAGGRVRVLPADGSDPGADIGAATRISASATPGHVWAFTKDADRGLAREVSLDGVVAREIELPAASAIGGGLIAAAAGLVVILPDGPMLLDSDTGQARRIEGRVLAVHDNTVLRTHCGTDLRCGLHIGSFDDVGRRVQVLQDRSTDQPASAMEFSPDGERLAIVSYAIDEEGTTAELLVVDVTDDELLTTVALDVSPFARPAWGPNSEWVFVPHGRDVVAVSRRGDSTQVPVDGVSPRVVAVVSQSQ